MKKKSMFKGKVRSNIDKKRAEKKGFGYLDLPEGVEMFKPAAGKLLLDILPYIVTDETHLDRDEESGIAVPGEMWWKKPFKVHKGIGPDEKTVVCPATFGDRCPICEHFNKLNKEGAEWDDIKELRAKDRSLYIVIPIDVEEHDEKPYVFDMSYHMFEKHLFEEIETEEENEIFPDLEEGLTLAVRFREKTFGKSKYYETSRIDFKEREASYEEDILEELPNLDELLKVLSYDELKNMFLEMEEPEEEDTTEEEDAPVDVKSFRRKKTTKVEEEPEEDEPEEKEPEKKTKQTKPSTSKAGKKASDDCPNGHKFGVDTDDYDECDACDKWDTCIEKKEE